jgi:hypothetical protein
MNGGAAGLFLLGTMPLDFSTFDSIRPTGDFIAVAPSFFVLIVPAVAIAVALGPLQAIAALAWLQVMQPRWEPGPILHWMTAPWALVLLTTAAVIEGVLDKVPTWGRRQTRLQLRLVPVVALCLGMAVVSKQPIDVIIGAGLLATGLSGLIFCCVAPTRESILDSGMASFVTPIASIVQSLLCFSVLLPMSQMPLLAGVLLLVVLLACGFMLVLDRRPFGLWWRAMFGLGKLPEPNRL